MDKQVELTDALNDLLRAELQYEECGEKCKAVGERRGEISRQVVQLAGQIEDAALLRIEIIERLLFDATAQLELDRHNDAHIRNERELTDLIDLQARATRACEEATDQKNAAWKHIRTATERHKKMIFATRAAAIMETCRESLEELALAALDTASGGDHPHSRARTLIVETLFPSSALSFDEDRRRSVVSRMRGESTPLDTERV